MKPMLHDLIFTYPPCQNVFAVEPFAGTGRFRLGPQVVVVENVHSILPKSPKNPANTMIQATSHWIENHQIAFTLILTAISILIGLYQQEVRRFLHEWPRTRKAIRIFRVNTAKNQLELLSPINGNAYNLNLWVLGKIVGTAQALLLWNTFFALGTAAATHKLPTGPTFFGVTGGILISEAIQFSRVIWQLHAYEYTSNKLKQKIAKKELKAQADKQGTITLSAKF